MILINDKNNDLKNILILALKNYKYDIDNSILKTEICLKEKDAYNKKTLIYLEKTKNEYLEVINKIDIMLKELEK